MSFIQLDRRFFEWNHEEGPDADLRRALGLDDGGVGWDELLLKHRVVILAEAGSGKSTEMKERARLLATAYRITFYATAEDVGREGLQCALDTAARVKLSEWRNSDCEAWFFIDSVDEAKSHRIGLEKVARKLSDAIHGSEMRAHIILSGRIPDWAFRQDLAIVKEWLKVPSRISEIAETSEQELDRILRGRWSRDEAPPLPEPPFVVRMAPLDRARVRLFAEGKATRESERFLQALDSGDHWHFAGRPLDLDWLVSHWQRDQRLGSLAEMIELSIQARLKEPADARARHDRLGGDEALRGVERIAAAMVFGRCSTIAVPDGEVSVSCDSALDLSDVLSDWTAENRSFLLTRPVFDPATLGRVRFHNDNKGVVRGFLAARWLLRLRDANLSKTTLRDLLFAKSYDLEVIRPSVSETAAWLSLWDSATAKEVAHRGPELLLGAGDPETLPHGIRREALSALTRSLANDDRDIPILDHGWLRRFADPCLAEVIKSLWPDCREKDAAAELLLEIVWLGSLKDCADLVYNTALDVSLGLSTRILAGRAVLVTNDEQRRKSYVASLMAQKCDLSLRILLDAIEDLFPALISVNELLTILERKDIGAGEPGIGFDWKGPRLAQKLSAPSDLEQFLHGLLDRLRGEPRDCAGYPLSDCEIQFFPAIAEAALRLLQKSSPETAPGISVDAILRVLNRGGHNAKLGRTVSSALAEIHQTRSRRRSAFWRVVENLRRITSPAPHRIEDLRDVEHSGYHPGLRVEDVDWLLEDGLRRDEDDRRLAVHCVVVLFRRAGEPLELAERILSAVSRDTLALQIWCNAMTPLQLPAAQKEWESEEAERRIRMATESAEVNQGWQQFIRQLRADPQRIMRLRVPPPSGVNEDLFNLWRLLIETGSNIRYSIDSIEPLNRIAGNEVAEAARDGLIALWRKHTPPAKSHLDLNSVNLATRINPMGVSGISLDVAGTSDWADRLSSAQAKQAALYATVELNGFPRWLPKLAAAHSEEVRDALHEEIMVELAHPDLGPANTLHTLAHSDDEIVELLALAFLKDLKSGWRVPSSGLWYVLEVIVRGVDSKHSPEFVAIAIDQFNNTPEISVAAQFLSASFRLDPEAATRALKQRCAREVVSVQSLLVDRFLSAAFDDSRHDSARRYTPIPGHTLYELVRLSFETHGAVSTRQRPLGVAYVPDENDYAGRARSAVLHLFANTPGAATYSALMRLQGDSICPYPARRLRQMARMRAYEDSERAPWAPSDARGFENQHEAVPRSGADLQALVIRRFKDLQHELLNGDFSQGQNLKACRREVDVQNWVACRLRLSQKSAFSVEREPRAAGEKMPDIRLQAKAADASVAIEIKVAEDWSWREIVDALNLQLCGSYLRAKEGRFGILLLVHKLARPKGWQDSNRTTLSFSDLVRSLSARAAEITAERFDGPQPEICFLDVSNVAGPQDSE